MPAPLPVFGGKQDQSRIWPNERSSLFTPQERMQSHNRYRCQTIYERKYHERDTVDKTTRGVPYRPSHVVNPPLACVDTLKALADDVRLYF